VLREKLRIKYSAHTEEKDNSHTLGLDEVFMQKANSILEDNYASEAFGIDELYHALGVSRVQLHRKLMALTGQSASHYIRSFRLKKAHEMLLATSKSVSEIAYETGFSDANYFSRVFAQEFGLPPSDVRKGGEKAVEKPV
jgi:transcriptional regulator GlxA family with amidase domain